MGVAEKMDVMCVRPVRHTFPVLGTEVLAIMTERKQKVGPKRGPFWDISWEDQQLSSFVAFGSVT